MLVRILFVSSEVAPYAKTGGLADVSQALSATLRAHGHDVRVLTPLYARTAIGASALRAVPGLEAIDMRFGLHRYRASIHSGRAPGSEFDTYFLHCPALFQRRAIYSNDADEHLRFVALSHAALIMCQRMRFAPDIIHANDWQTALIPLLLAARYRWDRLIFERTRTVLTIHNLNYQGRFPADIAGELGLEDSIGMLHQDQLRDGVINFLLHGIMYADAITTVSPTYAREIRGAERGVGLDFALNERSKVLFGILNGVDSSWNPATDKYLPVRYDAAALDSKGGNKAHLLSRAKLPHRPGLPLLGIVSRLAEQKGFEITGGALAAVLAQGKFQLAVLGQGEASLERMFHQLRSAFPQQVWFQGQFDEGLSHLIQGGADFLLVPSRYEPCGLTQMYAMTYGTVPIVRKTGGLADTVSQYSPSQKTGTGIVFDAYNGAAVKWSLDVAHAVYQAPTTYRELQRNGMAQDFSWDVAAKEYERVYRHVSP